MSDGLIAIVGASCRFPGATGLDAFWHLLSSGIDAVSEVDSRRWSTRFFYHPTRGEPGKSYTWSAGLLSGVDLFEPAFFGISPREAVQMDPQQRLLLELAWHAAEDAGIPTNRLAGSATGVYIGASSTDYRDLRLGDPANGDTYAMTGGTLSILANRISYVFDLRGPSFTVDTACSSSLVALHEACEALRGGRIESALVGGINLLLSPYPFIGFCRAAMLSQRGRCFAFDERADGYVRGEGGGIIILKPLARALADGDRVRAVILGTGVNSDGRTIGLSLPSEAAQADLLRSVYQRAEVAPDDLAFFEMHGTGTPAGDPIEAAAVGRALGQRRRAKLPIGSVKSNIGHLEPASGMAGLIKAMLAVDHGVVPPTLHIENPNPNIPFDSLNLRLLRRPEPLTPGMRNCVGVNSFGFGGTNGHAILAPPPSRAEPEPEAAEALPPLVVSARTEVALRILAQDWREMLTSAAAAQVPARLRAAARRRDQHSHRLVAFGCDAGSMADALSDFLADQPSASVVSGTAVRDGKLAFVFSGNGAQWPGMGSHAYRASALFRDAVAEADGLLRPSLGWSVAEMIKTGADSEQLVRADIAQPLLFAIQVGIVTVLRRLGIEASGHIGHSVGEIAAAWGAGALSLADAAYVVVARSRNQEQTRGVGRMAALQLGGAAARDLLAEMGSPLEVGAINATQSVTVSGPDAAIDRLGAEARRRGVAFRALDLDFAFHSAAMDPIRDGLLADLRGLTSREPDSLLISTVTGEPIRAGMLGAEYWWHNVRNPVRFVEAMAALIATDHRVFIEIGPNPVLLSYLHDGLRAGEAQGRVLATLSRKDADSDPFPTIAAQCHVAGHDLAAAGWFDGAANPRGLPLYPWQRERFWFERTVEGPDLTNPQFVHPLLGFLQAGPVPSWVNHLDQEIVPWLADHAIEGVPVFPAAAVLEMALAAARVRRPEARALEVIDAELRRPLPFDKGRARELRATLASEDGDWELASRPRLSDDPPTLHAVARLAAAAEGHTASRAMPRGAPLREVDADTLYRLAARLGLHYGKTFRTVARIAVFAPDEAVAELDPSVIDDALDLYLIHPALLDGALQGLLALLAEGQPQLQGVSFLPWRFGRVRVAAPFGRAPRRAWLRVTRLGTRSASSDIVLFDEAGAIVAELTDCWFRRVELTRGASIDDRALHIALVPAPLAEIGVPAGLDRIGAKLARLAAKRGDDRGRGIEQALLLDALIAAVADRAIREVIDPEVEFTVESLIKIGRVAPEAAALLDGQLCLLARFGAATAFGETWRLVTPNDLPAIGDVWRLLLAEAPTLVAELALVALASDELPRILVEGPRQPEMSPLPMVEQLLHASPVSAAGIGFVCDALERIAAKWPKGRTLRVLELGASDGATRRVLDRLAQSGVALDYVATSPDQDQATRLGFVVAPVTGAAARRWSPREEDDEFAGTRFDVVLSLSAGARLQLDPAGLSRLRELLATGGVFLAVEPEPNPLWELVFGRYAWWWRRGGGSIDISALRSREEWCGELAGAGFKSPGTAPIASGPWPSMALWGIAPATAESVAAKSPAALSIAVIAGDTSVGVALRADLADVGYLVADLDAAAFVASATEVAAEGQGVIVIVVVDEDRDADPVEQTAQAIARLARVAVAAAERRMPLWVVTAGAQQAIAGSHAGLVGAAVWGFGRVLVNETMPRLDLHLVDLEPNLATAEAARIVAAELTAATAETEIVWTDAGRHVLRLRRGLPPHWAGSRDTVALASDQPGGLDALGWKRHAPPPAGVGEVEIDVHAAGLNFRDMMWAMGLLPEEALIDGFAGPTFGLECAGVVRAVGPGVKEIAVGDRVAGFAPASLSSRVTTASHAIMSIPPEITFAEAATVPVAFVTVIYALGTLGKLEPGEHVLVHAAAGGVGLAAIQFAKHRGAIVFATAGSEIKRAFLRLAGADHVLDSRDLGFADAVRAITAGAGVDVVLNSLSGEAMENSIAVLKPFGRFLELGKRDFYLNRRIHLRPLRQNISYFAIDVDQLPVQRPDLARALLAELSAALASGAIRPLAHRTFPFAEIDDAFRLMQASGHIGKLVLVPRENAAVRLRQPPEFTIRAKGTYLVTGGLSGFGFEAARWLVQRGARSIALVGRRGIETPGAAERVAELAAAGAEIHVYAGDVADRASLRAVLREVRAQLPPLRGVIHAASAIGDGLASEVDAAAAVPILRPKLAGAIALDELTRDDPIELFLLFSSATTLLGAPGQGLYVAANLALEALARRRRAEGRPGLAVAWGPIEDAGYLADRPETRDALARRLRAKPIPAAQALSGLAAIAASRLPVVAFAETSWTEARRFLPILATPLFAEIRADASSLPSDDSLIERLVALNADDALVLLKSVVAEEAANILRLPAAGIDPLRPLSELGMDSLMAVELRLALETRLRIDLPLVSLAEGTSVASIAGRLAGAVSARPQAGELLGLAARYEAAEDAELAAALAAPDSFDPVAEKSAAAE